MHQFEGAGTQTPQLNGSFASNVRLRLLCFQKEQPPEVFCKKRYCSKIFTKFIGEHVCWSLFLIKMQAFRPTALLKNTQTQVFSCEYCETFKNASFEEYLQMAVSVSEIQQTVFKSPFCTLEIKPV